LRNQNRFNDAENTPPQGEGTPAGVPSFSLAEFNRGDDMKYVSFSNFRFFWFSSSPLAFWQW
jgi:hypothetical protein